MLLTFSIIIGYYYGVKAAIEKRLLDTQGIFIHPFLVIARYIHTLPYLRFSMCIKRTTYQSKINSIADDAGDYTWALAR
jgi:hypothetical protein